MNQFVDQDATMRTPHELQGRSAYWFRFQSRCTIDPMEITVVHVGISHTSVNASFPIDT